MYDIKCFYVFTRRYVVEVSRDDRLFPVVVSNFGCGPDAFAMKHLDDSAQGTPYLFLAFDEHRGEAGLITRLEAFIDEVSHWYGRRESIPGTTVPCLLQEYGAAMRRELDRAQKTGVAIMTSTGSEHFDILGTPSMVRLGRGLLACDLLTKVKMQLAPLCS